ncbi:MAG: imidazole glycerol phosphate synthase subunit HisH [bacterium]
MELTVLDYGAGNLKSITNMLDAFGYSYKITDKKEDLLNSERLIFPGVGNFAQVMEALESKNLTENLIKAIKSGIPFLGICLGLQVLFDESEEAPGIKGLGIFPGRIIRFTQGKVPQIGWNKLKTTANNSILTDDYVYFVNSYHAVPDNPDIVSAYSNYYINFTASIEYKNIIGVQFHPEKSGETGYGYINKWLKKSFPMTESK